MNGIEVKSTHTARVSDAMWQRGDLAFRAICVSNQGSAKALKLTKQDCELSIALCCKAPSRSN